jgi:tRNA U55 pseudouridine synthase TruB
MASLVRTEACGFSLEQAATVDELGEMSENERFSRLISLEELFSELPSVTLPTFYERLFRSGCEIYQKKIGTDHGTDEILKIYGNNCGFFALGKVKDYPDGSAIKSLKLFSL